MVHKNVFIIGYIVWCCYSAQLSAYMTRRRDIAGFVKLLRGFYGRASPQWGSRSAGETSVSTARRDGTLRGFTQQSSGAKVLQPKCSVLLHVKEANWQRRMTAGEGTVNSIKLQLPNLIPVVVGIMSSNTCGLLDISVTQCQI